MKNKIYKTSIATICLIAFTFTVQAQFPNFTKVDTGAITQLPGGHVSSTCFDMDNDGDLDIACSNSGMFMSSVFSIYRNERNGFYTEVPEFNSNLDFKNTGPHGDIENDGDVDLIAGPPYVILGVFPNYGYGNYQYYNSIYSPDARYYPILLDLNNDGYLDLVCINNWGSVCYNDGSGNFLPWENLGQMHPDPTAYLHGVAWGDVDNDGDMDFYGGYSCFTNPVNRLYLNNGNGGFEPFDPTSIIFDNINLTQSVNWVDYDNDGDLDLYIKESVWTLQNEGFNAIYENTGDMQFERHMIGNPIYNGTFLMSSVWGDLDNDADLDLYLTVENNVNPYTNDTSDTPYNLLFLNNGAGELTEFSGINTLVQEDTHTALLLDQDNDGDLDVLMTRYSWINEGYNNLYINGGNNNSWIVLTCEGTISNRTAIGTRVQAKNFVNGNYITQTREITPIHGHLSYANLRVHFGLKNNDVIDTLIIRWPSGIVDTYLNVAANQFYRAIENEELTIDFKATNYITYTPGIIADSIYHNTIIDLNEHFHLIAGDTLPQITGDTLTYSVYNNSNPGIIQTEVDGNLLTVKPLAIGETIIEILASAEFTEKLDSFTVNVVDLCLPDGIVFSTQEQIDNFQINYPGCNEIVGDVEINGDDIDNLDGLSVITFIGGYLKIISNDMLTGLSGLNNLTSICGNLEIVGNPILTELTGLDSIEPASINDLSIYYNPSLSECDVLSVCMYLNDPNGTIDIHDNNTSCNTLEDVELACVTTVVVDETGYHNQLTIIPNPMSGIAHLRFTINEQGFTICELFEISGVKVKQFLSDEKTPGLYNLEIDLRNLPKGVYFCILKTNGEVYTKKIIKL